MQPIGIPYERHDDEDPRFRVCPRCDERILEDHDASGETVTNRYAEHFAVAHAPFRIVVSPYPDNVTGEDRDDAFGLFAYEGDGDDVEVADWLWNNDHFPTVELAQEACERVRELGYTGWTDVVFEHVNDVCDRVLHPPGARAIRAALVRCDGCCLDEADDVKDPMTQAKELVAQVQILTEDLFGSDAQRHADPVG